MEEIKAGSERNLCGKEGVMTRGKNLILLQNQVNELPRKSMRMINENVVAHECRNGLGN